MKAAAAAHDQAPDTAGSHMPQHAHKRARVEPTQAPGRTGMEGLLQVSAARPVQAFTPVQTPQRLSTPEAAEIRRDMTIQNAPRHSARVPCQRRPDTSACQSAFHSRAHARSALQSLHAELLNAPSTPGQGRESSRACNFSTQIRFHLCRACPTLPTDCASSFGAGGIVHVPGA